MAGVVIRLWVLDPNSGYLPPIGFLGEKYDAIAKVVGEAAQGKAPELGPYLKAYNPDGNFGRGSWEFTDDIREARVFTDQTAAWQCWKAPSKLVPRRTDGKPNRPLTQFNITFEPAP